MVGGGIVDSVALEEKHEEHGDGDNTRNGATVTTGGGEDKRRRGTSVMKRS